MLRVKCPVLVTDYIRLHSGLLWLELHYAFYCVTLDISFCNNVASVPMKTVNQFDVKNILLKAINNRS